MKKWYSDVYTGTYYLESSIHIRNGSTLSIDGRESEDLRCETLLLVGASFTLGAIFSDLDGVIYDSPAGILYAEL